MELKMSELSIIFMVVAGLAGIIIPVGMLLFFRKRKRADIMPFWIGCAVFVVFALILERLAQFGFMQLGFWKAIQSNAWLYAIIGGLFAGVFEETGRFIAFKTVLKKKQDKDINALMYGAGHGGFEVLYLLSFTMLNNIVLSIMVNSGNTALLAAGGEAVMQMAKGLAALEPGIFLVAIVERLGAVTLHISLSVLVWFAAKNSKSILLYPAAILIHAFVDAAAIIMAQNGASILLIECALYVFYGLNILLAVTVWKKNRALMKTGFEKAIPA